MDGTFKIDYFFTDYHGFASIGHNILTFLDAETLVDCRSVCKTWKNFIDNERVLNLHLVKLMMQSPYNFTIGRVLKITILQDNGQMLKNLIQYAKSKNWEFWWICIEHPISLKFHWNFQCCQGNLLHFACQMRKVNCVKSILKWYQEFDIDLNGRDWKGRSPLTFACSRGHTEVVQALLKTPEFDVNTTDNQGWTPFMSAIDYAIARGKYKVVNMMLESNRTQDTDFRMKDQIGRDELIELTIQYGGFIMVKSLLEFIKNNADLLLEMLIKASSLEKIKVTMLLFETSIENSIEINDPDLMKSLFSTICRSGHSEHIKFFLEKDFDVNNEDKNGNTPFFSVCSAGNIEAVRVFIEHATLNNPKPQIDGTTGFYIACSLGHFNIVSLLLQHRHLFIIDLNARYNSTGQTPFHAACSKGQLEVVKLLLENAAKRGIDVMAADQKGNTPIQCACNIIKKTKVFVRTLQFENENGADPYADIVILLMKYYQNTNFTNYDQNLVKECLSHHRKMKAKKRKCEV